MSKKIEVVKDRNLMWPNKCPLCENKANSQDRISKAKYKGKGYYVVFLTYTQTLYSLSYPICKKHKYYAKFLRFTYWALLMPVIVLGLSALFTIAESGLQNSINLISVFLVCLILFVLSIKLQPIRIVDATDNSLKIIFRDNKYAEEFIRLNH